MVECMSSPFSRMHVRTYVIYMVWGVCSLMKWLAQQCLVVASVASTTVPCGS